MKARSASVPAIGPPTRKSAGLIILISMGATSCILLTAYLWPEWKENPDLTHGFFAPLLFLLLLWHSRQAGPERYPGHSPIWTALRILSLVFAPIAIGLASILAISQEWTHPLVSFILVTGTGSFLFALLLCLGSERVRLVPVNWISLAAIGMWVLSTPLPPGTYHRLSLLLQDKVTTGVLQTLRVLGIPAHQQGNIIDLVGTKVGVEEACSGVRSLFSCVFAAVFFSAFLLKSLPRRLFLIAMAVPVAIGMNFLRSLVLTLMAYRGVDISGFWHDVTGFAILGGTAVMLFGLALLMETPAGKCGSGPPARVSPAWAQRFALSKAGIVSTGAAFMLSVSILLFFHYEISKIRHDHSAPAPAIDLTDTLPKAHDGWDISEDDGLFRFAGTLRTESLLQRTYRKDDTVLIAYVAHWNPGQAPVSLVASHTPDACWPGAGWEHDQSRISRVEHTVDNIDLPPAEYRFFQFGPDVHQHVYYWHLYQGEVLENINPRSVPQLLRISLNYGLRSRGDQAFIRLSSNRTWEELAQDPLLKEIVTRLAVFGL